MSCRRTGGFSVDYNLERNTYHLDRSSEYGDILDVVFLMLKNCVIQIRPEKHCSRFIKRGSCLKNLFHIYVGDIKSLALQSSECRSGKLILKYFQGRCNTKYQYERNSIVP